MSNELTYEAAYEELQDILKDIENGEVSLDDITKKVQRAGYLLEYCQKRLRALETDLEGLLESNE